MLTAACVLTTVCVLTAVRVLTAACVLTAVCVLTVACVCADCGVCADHGAWVLVAVGSSGGAARAPQAQVNVSDFSPCEGCSLSFRP